jgi:hypothetical protein
MNFKPSSAGTARDLREHTDLAGEVPFFGSEAEAQRFVWIGLEGVRSSLPPLVNYADFGGGQGTLATVVRDYLEAAGHRVTATVVDGNHIFLEQARQAGLSTMLANIEQCNITGLDLATMRLVNHYNNEQQQKAMLEAVYGSLKKGAPFISHIETGHPIICELHKSIAELLSLTDDSDIGYFWPTLDQYVDWLKAVGFESIQVAGNSPDIETSVEQALSAAWRRFNGYRVEQAVARGAASETEALLAQKKRFFAQAKALIHEAINRLDDADGIVKDQLLRMRVRMSYPIVVCRDKNSSPEEIVNGRLKISVVRLT